MVLFPCHFSHVAIVVFCFVLVRRVGFVSLWALLLVAYTLSINLYGMYIGIYIYVYIWREDDRLLYNYICRDICIRLVLTYKQNNWNIVAQWYII